MPECGDDTLQFEEIFLRGTKLLFHALNVKTQDARIFFGGDGKTMLVIEDAELAALSIEDQLQVALFEYQAVLFAQEWNQDLALKFIFDRIPVDIEEIGVVGGFSVFE